MQSQPKKVEEERGGSNWRSCGIALILAKISINKPNRVYKIKYIIMQVILSFKKKIISYIWIFLGYCSGRTWSESVLADSLVV